MEYFEHPYDVHAFLGAPPKGAFPQWDEIQGILSPLLERCRGQAKTRHDRDYYFEAWAPSWTVCKKDRLPPDLFFSMTRMADTDDGPPLFSFLALLALGPGLSGEGPGKEAALSLDHLFHSRISVWKNRPWGYAWEEGGGYFRGVQDLPSEGLFRAGPHVRSLDKGLFEPGWQELKDSRKA